MLILAYISAMVAANISVSCFGPWISPINSFLFIGLDLTLRDKIHERNNGDARVMTCVVLGAAVVTYIINPAAQSIAIASAVAFAAAGIIDWITYSMLRERPIMTRTNGSNIAGAVIDSTLFAVLAFGALLPHIVVLQFAAKVAGGAVWAFALRGSK